AARERHRHQRGPQLLHDAHGGALPPLRRTPRPCFQRWPAADRPALLYERRGVDIRAPGEDIELSASPERKERPLLRLIASTVAAVVLLVGHAAAQTAAPQATEPPMLEVATFAAGCFWCTEADFDKVKGVVETTSGYMGGTTPNPTYEQVSSGSTGHAEVMQLKYDPSEVTYEELLDVYWRNVDPLDGGGQFCDRGSQYRPAIFYHTEEQKRLAEASKTALEESGRFDQP